MCTLRGYTLVRSPRPTVVPGPLNNWNVFVTPNMFICVPKRISALQLYFITIVITTTVIVLRLTYTPWLNIGPVVLFLHCAVFENRV